MGEIQICSCLSVCRSAARRHTFGTYGSESHVLDIVQLLDDSLVSTSAVFADWVALGCSTSIGTCEPDSHVG
jgi:hypothetical protein